MYENLTDSTTLSSAETDGVISIADLSFNNNSASKWQCMGGDADHFSSDHRPTPRHVTLLSLVTSRAVKLRTVQYGTSILQSELQTLYTLQLHQVFESSMSNSNRPIRAIAHWPRICPTILIN